MKAVAADLLFSATDLSNFLACPHLTRLDRAVQVDGLGKPRTFDDPGLDVLKARGQEHERAYLERLKGEGKSVAEVSRPSPGLPDSDRWERHAADTLAAMRSGEDVVYQAGLYDGTWVGLADFLVRVEEPSELGAWSYEVVDTKLAREAKGGALLQVLLYADLVAKSGTWNSAAMAPFMGPSAACSRRRVSWTRNIIAGSSRRSRLVRLRRTGPRARVEAGRRPSGSSSTKPLS